MKILYAIRERATPSEQGRRYYPDPAKKGEVDILVSGIQADVELSYPVKYKFRGLSFIFGKRGH
jgi:hypothetical protein